MIDVSCALIISKNGQLLVTQRSAVMRLPLKWEFPGGKIEEGETAGECIVREIREELGIAIEIEEPMTVSVYDDGKLAVRLIPFRCKLISGEIRLAEHAAFQWLFPDELTGLDWAEADLPVLKEYLDSL